MNVGDLVTMKETTAPPALYGLGLILEKNQLCSVNKNAVRVKVQWSGGMGAEPRVGDCHPSCLELVSAPLKFDPVK